MKKILSVVLACCMIGALMSVAAFAGTFNQGGNCFLEVTLKKADPSAVVKDGVIGEGEYERYVLDTDPESPDCNLNLNFGQENPGAYLLAEEMCKTMEYYFSWDDTHGLNFAVKCTPPILEQIIDEGTGDPPQDNFLGNVGFQFAADPAVYRAYEKDGTFIGTLYYAIAKRTDTGAYLEGHYNQFGLLGKYDPVAGQDYVISYPGDGSVICEWSIPFSYWLTDYSVGTEVYFTVCTTGTPENTNYADSPKTGFSVSLGDYGWLTLQKKNVARNLTGIISDETVVAAPVDDTTGDTTTSATGTTAPAETKVNEDGKVVVIEKTTNEKGEEVIVEREATPEEISQTTNTTGAAQTADPIMAVAAVCALSAGAVLVLRKKH